MKKGWKILLVVFVAFAILGAIVSMFEEEETVAPEPEEQEEAEPDETEPEEEEPEPEFDWTVAEITEENIKESLKAETVVPFYDDENFPENITAIEILDHDDPAIKDIVINYEAGTFWDETDFIKRAGGTAIVAGSILFNNPSVGGITLNTETSTQDQYGNSKMEAVVEISIDRELADKANWEGLADRHITDPGNIYRLSPWFNIHPGILKNVKLDEVVMY